MYASQAKVDISMIGNQWKKLVGNMASLVYMNLIVCGLLKSGTIRVRVAVIVTNQSIARMKHRQAITPQVIAFLRRDI
jgi:hypothetical protein